MAASVAVRPKVYTFSKVISHGVQYSHQSCSFALESPLALSINASINTIHIVADVRFYLC